MKRRRGTFVAATVLAVGWTVAPGVPEATSIAEQPLPGLSAPALAARYAQNQRAITGAAQAARRTGDEGRAVRLAALAAPGRQFLAFDARGRGRAIEVVGDLAHARRVAILVPGADTTVSTFDSRGPASPGGGARSLYAQARTLEPAGGGRSVSARELGDGTRSASARARGQERDALAVVAWLGYDAPGTLSLDVATTNAGRRGAGALRPLVEWIARRGAGVALLCHSYGTVVCGAAAPGLPATDLAVFGSPGMIAPSAPSLRTRARVWAALGGSDWMRYVPKQRLLGMGLGLDPTGPDFGARRFAAGPGGHSDYLKSGGVSLRNLALIALGRPGEVTGVR